MGVIDLTDVRSLDIEPLATVTLSNGSKMDVPRLTTVKLIRIAKFIAIDGMGIYERNKKVIEAPDMTDTEKVAVVVTDLKDEQIIHLLAILLDISDEEALRMDPIDHLEIITTFVEKTDTERAFTNVQKLIATFRPEATNQVLDGVQQNNEKKYSTS